MPLSSTYVYSSINLGVFFIFSLSSLNVYGVILAGWASNSRYAILGCLRSAAQIVSYEIPLGFVLLTVVLCAGSFDMLDIVYAQAYTGMFGFGLLPVVPVFLVSLLAETNRAPFDLPEAEAELVAGFNVEYSSLAFALFFLGEYCNMLLMSTLCCLFFLSGWLLPSTLNSLGFFIVAEELVLSLKVSFICFLLVFVRANYPRYRYDQLLFVGWKVLVPISFSFFIAIVFILFFCGGLSGF